MAAARSPLRRARELPFVTGIDNDVFLSTNRFSYLIGISSEIQSRLGSEDDLPGLGRVARQRSALRLPFGEPTIEHRYPVVAVVPQRPPETRGEMATRVIDDHDVSFVTDADVLHRRLESLGWRDLGGDIRVRIDDVPGPIN